MRTFLIHLSCLGFFITLLLFPSAAQVGTKNGLLLWYTILLPSLLPFVICSNLLVASNAFSLLVKIIGFPIKCLFGLSTQGVYPVIIGFLCGYPMGAKAITDLYTDGHIEKNEANYLLTFCNNPSPAFVIGVLITQIIQDTNLLGITLSAIYLSPCIVSLFTRHIYKFNTISTSPKLSNLKMNIKTLDSSIVNGIHLMVKIGGYIVFFSILVSLLQVLPAEQYTYIKNIVPYLECTNGLELLRYNDNFLNMYLSLLSVVSFGGVCAIAQTQCLLQDTDLRIIPYVITKIITAILTVIIAYLLIMNIS